MQELYQEIFCNLLLTLSIEAIENVRGEDFDIRHNNDFDPFSYLGNGQLERETQEGSDLAFYIK